MGKNMVSQYNFLGGSMVHLAIQSCRGGAAPVSEAESREILRVTRKGKFGTGGMIRATLW